MPVSASQRIAARAAAPSAVEIEIVKGALRAAQGEMESVLERTAMSPFIREKKDYFCGIHDAKGRIVICTPMPFFGDLTKPVLDVYPLETMLPGDIYWYNDCYGSRGAISHSSDQVFFTPVFFNSAVVAMAQCWAHFADIGGLRPGSMSPDTTDIYQEGIIIPPMRLARAGEIDESLLRLFERNSRFPKFIRGDVRAMMASIRVAERRVVEMCERFGVEFLEEAFDEIIDQTSRALRTAREKTFKPGKYAFTDFVEHDAQGHGPFKLEGELTVDGNGTTLDLTNSSDQAPGPINFLMHPFIPKMMLGLQLAADQVGLLYNHGFESVLDDVKLREGSILQPQEPAPLGQRGLTLTRLSSVLSGLINVATNGQAMAGSNSYALYYMRGKDDRGNPFLLTDGVAVGYGARTFADGIDAVYLVAQENYPAEFLETTYPVRLLRYEINRDSGGPGRWRGGAGVVREIELLADHAMLSNRISGGDYPPWGASGGKAARAGRVVVNLGRADERILLSMTDGTLLKKGDVLRMETGGGGGWGDPFDREAETVRRDVLGEFVSKDSALEDYGVVLVGDDLEIDEVATKSRREKRHSTTAMFHRKQE